MQNAYICQCFLRFLLAVINPFICRSMEFAQKAWSNSLYVDIWASSGKITLTHPNEVSDFRRLSSTTTIFWSSGRSWDDILGDRTKSKQQSWNDAIAIFSTDQIEGNEILGSRKAIYDVSCSNCGWGLTSLSCSGCGLPTKSKLLNRGSGIPLPDKFTPKLREKGLLTYRDSALYSMTGRINWSQFFFPGKYCLGRENK
jgi:hypothetical protein